MVIKGLNKLLIIDDEENMLHMLSSVMRKEGYDVVTALNGRTGLEFAISQKFNIILCDLKMPQMDGLAFLSQAKARGIDATIIMMSAYASVDTAVEAMKKGAYDFITKPFNTDQIICVLEKVEEYHRIRKENIRLKNRVEELRGENTFASTIGRSQGINAIIDLAKKVARHDTPVLITGESGTGKELIARGIHNHSSRADGPMISVNCGSIPVNLLESEFFGYVKGAFTGADSNSIGLFEAADGGTLFLDEIGELPLGLQVKLLRVLQEREIRPVGGLKPRKIDVRVLTATAKDLEREVALGNFRQDLFFRFNVVILKLPPLRDRKEDIPFLCNHFLRRFNIKMNLKIENVSAGAMALLMACSWKGNIRELENCLERAMIFAESNQIVEENLSMFSASPANDRSIDAFLGTNSLKKAQKILEKQMIERSLNVTKGNKSKAAKMLEISYPSLLAKIKEYDL